MTLDRVLSRFGLGSRSGARRAILAGRLKVNGRVVRDPEHWVRTERDVFHLDGERLRRARQIYLLFYKPKGVITSYGDPAQRKTVYDYLDKKAKWVSPVGRLDNRGKYTWLEVVLTEGKNREVRRMLEAVGFKVLKLVRTRIGPLTLENIEVGRYRTLEPSEVAALRRYAGLRGQEAVNKSQ